MGVGPVCTPMVTPMWNSPTGRAIAHRLAAEAGGV